jgi:DNA-binding MarR family transcriptional regulator
MKCYHVGYYIKKISNNFENSKRTNCEKYDITSQQTSILLYLFNHLDEKVNQKTLEHYYEISSATISGIITRMEAKNLIVRIPNPDDKRDKLITLSVKGEETANAIKKSILDLEAKIVKGFDDNEIKTLLSFLERMSMNIKEEK